MENKENIATANGRGLPISTKQSVEVCNYLKGKVLQRAKKILEDVITKKHAIPFKRYKRDLAHKKGNIAAGRYPIKTSQHILKLLKQVEANAQFKGLDTSNSRIISMVANKASTPWHYGRKRRRKMKRTHIEVIIKESPKKETKGERKAKKK